MKAISTYNVVIRFGCLDESFIVLRGEKGVWQISAKLLQETGNTVHIMEEVFGVTEIKVPRIRI